MNFHVRQESRHHGETFVEVDISDDVEPTDSLGALDSLPDETQDRHDSESMHVHLGRKHSCLICASSMVLPTSCD